ncbi:LAFE_0D12794g1_1 [Lachancea fermentati]|uniref:LAFE_0D12794g1_1 n=1 Tax=Lachancea fermentati TaxID=4955 RepID=A0A1G4MC10_LACFM|nr:LAFE_0D12794g1_1 [Lachancea fermentati]
MAKKFSKHSRAARRLEVEEPEAKDLSKLPRVDNADVTNKLIRTASKNEQLLEARMRKKSKQNNKVGKKQSVKVRANNLDKERLERALNFSNRLDGKVQRAESRAKYVQSARKAGWDSTNESIKRELAALQNLEKEENKDLKKVEDEMDADDEPESADADTEATPTGNAFALLSDDVEA